MAQNLKELYFIEKIVTKAMKGCKRSIRELYVFMPSLFERGTRSYTILEPFLYDADNFYDAKPYQPKTRRA
jgi:hypothetical protein